jgi:hypothetical protein
VELRHRLRRFPRNHHPDQLPVPLASQLAQELGLDQRPKERVLERSPAPQRAAHFQRSNRAQELEQHLTPHFLSSWTLAEVPHPASALDQVPHSVSPLDQDHSVWALDRVPSLAWVVELASSLASMLDQV